MPVLGLRSQAPATKTPAHRLPVGVGLTIGALLSGGLWLAVILAVKALLF